MKILVELKYICEMEVDRTDGELLYNEAVVRATEKLESVIQRTREDGESIVDYMFVSIKEVP